VGSGTASLAPTPAPTDRTEYDWDDRAKVKVDAIKPILIAAIKEVEDELEGVVESVAKGAGSHIHST
jgi:hypothetical protein